MTDSKTITKSQITGSFFLHSHLSASLKNTLRNFAGYDKLSLTQTEAIEQMIHAISHIVTGENNYLGYWRSISELVDQELKELNAYPAAIDSTTTYKKVDTGVPF